MASVDLFTNGFTQNTVIYSNFTYQETSIQPNLTGSQPHILTIVHYNDNSGTAIVRIGRENYYNYVTKNYCYEQRLLIRVIQKNGSVIPINYENPNEIQDINYCYITSLSKNPLNIYPLFDQYILVTYTYATNTSDTSTYVDRGMVFNWDGKIISKLEFDKSFLSPGTINWHPNEYVVNNISPKKGFLRLSMINGIGTNSDFFKWSQFGYNDNGSFFLLAEGIVSSIQHLTSFQVTVFATLDGGYALVYAKTTSRTFNSNNMLATQFSENAGIHAIMLGYNQSTTLQSVILYQFTTPNLNFTGLYCSVDFVYIGHSCIAYVTQTQTSQIQNVTTTVITTTITPSAAAPTVIPVITTVTAPPTTITSSDNFYVKIRFLSCGFVISLDPIFATNNGSLTIVRTLPYGGYALIDRIISGSNMNFTFELYDESNALANYNFPIRPLITNFNGAFDILPNNTMLVALSETTTTSWQILSVQLPSLSPYNDNVYGNLHVSATYPPKGSKNLTLNSNSINITYQDPITLNKGNLYIYQSTINGSKILRQLINAKFCNIGNGCSVSGKVVTLKVLDCTFNDPNAQYYIEVDNDFIKSSIYNEPILGIDPNMWTFNTVGGVIQGLLRLTSDGTQYFQNLNVAERERFFNHLIDELTILIPTENGRLSSNGNYQKDTSDSSKIIITLSISETKGSDNQRISTEIESNLNLLIKNKEFTGISTKPTTQYLDETYGYQRYLLAFTILFSEKSEEYIDWFVQYGRVAVTFALASGTNIDTLLILRARLMNIEMFKAPFSDRSLTTIFWGACVAVFLTEIPQFILQIIVLNSSVLFDFVPIFAAVASGLSVLASITSKLFFIRHKAYSPYLSHFVEKRKTIIMYEKVEKQTHDTNDVVDTNDRK
ncbi:42129_t:CDS:2 [Gigaspora margarita]|uniref:42129_t:CDS:1 n=1 Tax=Gigaspora margarita TaxID=4874 RepID=A0ABN7V5W1_GIGMA|nr:42129_t:CDS:2 [Gigaspora margarita]